MYQRGKNVNTKKHIRLKNIIKPGIFKLTSVAADLKYPVRLYSNPCLHSTSGKVEGSEENLSISSIVNCEWRKRNIFFENL